MIKLGHMKWKEKGNEVKYFELNNEMCFGSMTISKREKEMQTGTHSGKQAWYGWEKWERRERKLFFRGENSLHFIQKASLIVEEWGEIDIAYF